MNTSYLIRKNISINASTERLWETLASPQIIKQFMFGAEIASTWQKGDMAIYPGQWDDGHASEDKRVILEITPSKTLQRSYFNTANILEDQPENNNLITFEVTPEDDSKTILYVTQDNIPYPYAADFVEKNWDITLTHINFLSEGQ